MPNPKPNVIVLLTDDQGYGDLCGLESPEPADFDGVSLARPLRNEGEIGDRMLIVAEGRGATGRTCLDERRRH